MLNDSLQDAVNTSQAGLSPVTDLRWRVPPRRVLQRKRKRMRFSKQLFEPFDMSAWDEAATEPADLLLLDAETFTVTPVFDVPSAKLEQITDSNRRVVSSSGRFAYQNRVLHVGNPLDLHGHGQVLFTDDVVIPMLIDLSRAKDGTYFDSTTEIASRMYFGNVWMSLTPNEMISQRKGIELARGTVVVGGLGLGWFVQKICEKPVVDRVIVVERSQELLDWYGYKLCAKESKVSDVLCDDIYNQLGKHGANTQYLLDIWPTQDGATSDPEFKHHKSQLGERLWGWGWNPRSSLLEQNDYYLDARFQAL